MYYAMIDGKTVELSQEDYEIIRYRAPATEGQIRSKRDGLIAETDVWALSDRTMSAEQTAYRQALRDITAQSGFPTDITWPTKPE